MHYIKVHKKGDLWFREDNGAVIGINIPPGEIFNHMQILVGQNRLFAKKGNNIISIYHGYFKGKNFFRFCSSKRCESCSQKTQKLFCPYVTDELKNNTKGYYIVT